MGRSELEDVLEEDGEVAHFLEGSFDVLGVDGADDVAVPD